MGVTYFSEQHSQIIMRFIVAEGCRLKGQEQGSNLITAGVLLHHISLVCGRFRTSQWCSQHMQPADSSHLGICRYSAPALYLSQQTTAGSTICLAQHSMASQAAAAACL